MLTKTLEMTRAVLLKQFDTAPMDILVNCTLADLYEEEGDEKRARIHRLIAQDEIHIYYDARPSTVPTERWDIFVPESVTKSRPTSAWEYINKGWRAYPSDSDAYREYVERMYAHVGWYRTFDAAPLAVVEKLVAALEE